MFMNPCTQQRQAILIEAKLKSMRYSLAIKASFNNRQRIARASQSLLCEG